MSTEFFWSISLLNFFVETIFFFCPRHDEDYDNFMIKCKTLYKHSCTKIVFLCTKNGLFVYVWFYYQWWQFSLRKFKALRYFSLPENFRKPRHYFIDLALRSAVKLIRSICISSDVVNVNGFYKYTSNWQRGPQYRRIARPRNNQIAPWEHFQL